MIGKYLPLLLFCTSISSGVLGQTIGITNDVKSKKLTFGNAKIKAILNYDRQADISYLAVNGQVVINGQKGIFSEIRTKAAIYSSLRLSKTPCIRVGNQTITVDGIHYGDSSISINERWIFTIGDSTIKFSIGRTLSRAIEAEQVGSPAILFSNIASWDGAFQDYGGLAWFYLFNKRLDTYGTHSRAAKFWNSTTGNGLRIAIDAPDQKVAMAYSRTAKDELSFTTTVSPAEIRLRYDSGTYRRRFLSDSMTDVWAPVEMNAGTSKQDIVLSYFDFRNEYDRGNLVGIDGRRVNDVLNTIARIGVIDKEHFGGNSWHTPYGPICLHEQYIAQMGLAIDDPDYLKGYRQCLDFYRDNAIKPDGRVWPRWAYTNEDAMPGAFTDKGFYEAQWGYLLDANTDLVTNVSELYDLTGDKVWVKTHQRSCEKVLDWLLERDSNHNGLVEMMTDSMQQKKSSDWIDIIWASYENAFVNAKLYHALVLWANIEKQLGNSERAGYYKTFAQKLKTSFNKPTSEGGFWDEENRCYIHWRDKNGSIHGRNMVTPVNFMAIGYGICDDTARIKTILDTIETQMEKERLFFWPLCMTSYARGEGNSWQFPFPNYENGDIFLSWGALGVKVYADYKPELALKYVKNVLARYAKDGLAYQRYGRTNQNGLGDDILAGNCLSIVGLYQAIYGINPLYNRFYLDPHITRDLAGTRIDYKYRNQRLTIDLAMKCYSVSDKQFTLTDSNDFGTFFAANELFYFNRANEKAAMKISTGSRLKIGVKYWSRDSCSWIQSPKDGTSKKLSYQLNGLKPNRFYDVWIDNKRFRKIRTDVHGGLVFTMLPDAVRHPMTIFRILCSSPN